jgi:hypothetical protein
MAHAFHLKRVRAADDRRNRSRRETRDGVAGTVAVAFERRDEQVIAGRPFMLCSESDTTGSPSVRR